MNYSYKDAFLRDKFEPDHNNDSPVINIFLITLNELSKEVKEQKIESVDVLEIIENFGIRYTAKINFFNISYLPKNSICILGSKKNSILFSRTIRRLQFSLNKCGYHCSERDLKIFSHFLGI